LSIDFRWCPLTQGNDGRWCPQNSVTGRSWTKSGHGPDGAVYVFGFVAPHDRFSPEPLMCAIPATGGLIEQSAQIRVDRSPDHHGVGGDQVTEPDSQYRDLVGRVRR